MPHVSDLAIKMRYARERDAYAREQQARERRRQLAQRLMQLASLHAVHVLGSAAERGLQSAHAPDLFGLDALEREERQQ